MPPLKFYPIDWHKSKDVLSHMQREYDKCFSNQKASGFHDKNIPTDIVDMTEVCKKTFANFSKNRSSILYLHEFILQFPGTLDKITGEICCSVYNKIQLKY